jgi:hypothetical protein
MTFTGRTITSQNGPSLTPGGREGAARVVRFVARVVLWGCLLILLLRGVGAVLSTEPNHAPSRTQTVTVTGPSAGTPATEKGR